MMNLLLVCSSGSTPSPDKGRVGEGFTHYNIKHTERARQLRKNATQAENYLWAALRKRQFLGLKFLRQKPIGQYIVDFYCAELLLVIEADGDAHCLQHNYDVARDHYLSSLDMRVLRFTNRQILENIASVLFTIEKYIKPINHYLALGDSYTIGEGVAECDCWPEQWARRMNQQGHAIEQPVRIIAETGWTTDELLQAVDNAGEIDSYQYVSLLIGVNNQYRGRNLNEYKSEFKQLAEKAICFADNKPQQVFVLSIPDWGQTPFGQASGRNTGQISQEIDSFNLAAEKLCQHLKIRYWDITAITRGNSTNTLMHAKDGLHPSQLMYEIWINTLFSH